MNPLQTALEIVFWGCAGLVIYAYFGYPLLVWCLARWFGKRRETPVVTDEGLPPVSLLVAAYNEEDVIEKRIQSALAMDYPSEKLEVIVASDGSSDRTGEIVRRYAHRKVSLLDYEERRGKAAVLNSSFAEVTSDIVLLSDANTQIDPCAVRKIVRWFQDPEVGVVCGRLILTDSHTGHNVDGLYWKYETWLKRCDGRLGALLGANGAIYAIRRELFTPIPNETIVDDLIIPLRARLKTGCAIVYESEAVAREETSPDIRSEFHRRSRIGAGGFQSICMLWNILDPRNGWVTFTFVSHKVLRWLCPFFMVGALLSNFFLRDRPAYGFALLGQIGFYLVSVLGAFAPTGFKLVKILRLTTMFTSMNAALLVGFMRWMLGTQKAAWRRTARVPEMDPVLR